jgi:hypothetical protein
MVSDQDQMSFAQLVQLMQEQLAAQDAARNAVPVAERIGAGPFTFTEANEGGKRLRVGNGNAAATITIILPKNANIGTVFMVRQVGLGRVKVVVENGASLWPYQTGHNGTAAIYAVIILTCERNDDGNSAVWHLDGISGVVA